MTLTHKEIKAVAEAVVSKFADDDGLRRIIREDMMRFNGGNKTMPITPDDIETIAEAVVRKFANDDGLRRMFREEAVKLLLGEPEQVAYYNPLLMDDRQLSYAEEFLATDEERKILRTRVMAERLAARGNLKSANNLRKRADRMEMQFEAKTKKI